MTNTLIGIALGIVATLLISRYYFRRTVRKSLALFRVLSAQVFAGIEPGVRKLLRFTYKDKEIKNLHQLEFLVANDGERSISNLIEPLQVRFPANTEILDASILHREPTSLQASLRVNTDSEARTRLLFDFPLLNKGDFFLVKLLLSGEVSPDALRFEITAEDLPRSIKLKEIPPYALERIKPRVRWVPVAFGLFFMGVSGAIDYSLVLLLENRPDLFPYPWSTFRASLGSILALPTLALGSLAIGLFGFLAFWSGGLGGVFYMGRKFHVPKELQRTNLELLMARMLEENPDLGQKRDGK